MAISGLELMFEDQNFSAVVNYYVGEATFNPASTTYVLGLLGLTLFCLAVLHRWVDQNQTITGKERMFSFFRRYSYFALTTYIAHHAVHLWPLWLYAAWQGKSDLTFYYGQAMQTSTALALSVFFIGVFYFFLIFLERHRKYSLESLLRWICE